MRGISDGAREKGCLTIICNPDRVPVLALSNQFLNVPRVSIHAVLAAHGMAEYLVGPGHRRIGYISGPSGLTISKLRQDGYPRALSLARDPVRCEPGG